MAKQWVKKEVRRDPLVSFATSAERFLKEKPRIALSIAGGTLAALILIGLLFSAHTKNRDTAYTSLLRAGSNVFANPDYALSLCDKLLSENQHSSRTHALARYIKGDALFVKGDYAGAFDMYSASRPKVPEELMPDVIYGQGKAKEALGQFNEAMQHYNEFIGSHAGHHLALEVYLSMARIFSVSGQPDNAAVYIGLIKERAQGSKWAQYADDLLPKAAQ